LFNTVATVGVSLLSGSLVGRRLVSSRLSHVRGSGSLVLFLLFLFLILLLFLFTVATVATVAAVAVGGSIVGGGLVGGTGSLVLLRLFLILLLSTVATVAAVQMSPRIIHSIEFAIVLLVVVAVGLN